MRYFLTLLTLLFLFLISEISASVKHAFHGSATTTVATFRNFPNNAAWRDSIIGFATKSNNPATVENRTRAFLDRKKIISSQIIFNLKGQKSYLWVYNKPIDKKIAIFATRSTDKIYKNLGVLFESWKDTLFVFDQLTIAIDSSVYLSQPIAFQERGKAANSKALDIHQNGGSIYITPPASAESTSWPAVDLVSGGRTENRVLHFFTNEEKKAIDNVLQEYLPYDYTTNEYICILLSEFPTYRTIDELSFEKYITLIKGK
jgi:hypothetical protein